MGNKEKRTPHIQNVRFFAILILIFVLQLAGTMGVQAAAPHISFDFRTPGLYTVGNNPYEAVTADFNEDTYPDLAVTNNDDGTVSILL